MKKIPNKNRVIIATLEKKVEELELQAKGWENIAAQFARGMEYYVGLLDEIAKNFGREAYISDDGSIQDSPLRAKMPELVEKVVRDGGWYVSK